MPKSASLTRMTAVLPVMSIAVIVVPAALGCVDAVADKDQFAVLRAWFSHLRDRSRRPIRCRSRGSCPRPRPKCVSGAKSRPVISTSGTRCTQLPLLPGSSPAASNRSVSRATVSSSPLVPGIRPSNSSEDRRSVIAFIVSSEISPLATSGMSSPLMPDPTSSPGTLHALSVSATAPEKIARFMSKAPILVLRIPNNACTEPRLRATLRLSARRARASPRWMPIGHMRWSGLGDTRPIWRAVWSIIPSLPTSWRKAMRNRR